MMWADFHFLRPWWLLLMFLAVALFFVSAPSSRTSRWSKVIDPHLLMHLLQGARTRRQSRLSRWFFPFFLMLLSLALAGPTVERIPTDVAFHKAPVIIALELSEHMLARDINPSRLKRALFKLEDFLNRYKGAEIALVAFAGDAHLVVPLSDDYNTILSLAKTLTPDLMPVRGVRITSALQLIEPIVARNPRARVVIMTSTNLDESVLAVTDKIAEKNYAVTLWTFATPLGAPTQSSEGRFNQGANGIAISKLQRDLVDKIDKVPGAASIMFSLDATDVDQVIARVDAAGAPTKKELFFDTWFDLGPYVLVFAVVMFVLTFFFARDRIWLFSLVLLFQAQPSDAGIMNWFLRKDQQAQIALETGDPEKAATLFEDDARKGAAYYKAKKYDQAIEHLSKVNTSDGNYNLGNALVQKGQYQEAVAAYSEALKLDPNNADAKFNKELVEKLLKEQKQDQQQQQQQNPPEDKKDEQEKSSQEQKESEQSEQKDGQGGEKQDSPPKEPDPSKGEGGEPKPKSDEQKKESEQKVPAPKQEENEKPQEEKMKEAKPGEHGNIDKETQYYFDRIEQRDSLYLKRKFRFETEKNQRRP